MRLWFFLIAMAVGMSAYAGVISTFDSTVAMDYPGCRLLPGYKFGVCIRNETGRTLPKGLSLVVVGRSDKGWSREVFSLNQLHAKRYVIASMKMNVGMPPSRMVVTISDSPYTSCEHFQGCSAAISTYSSGIKYMSLVKVGDKYFCHA